MGLDLLSLQWKIDSERLSKMPTAGEQQSQYGELCLDNDIPTRNFREYESILFEDIFFLALLPKLKNWLCFFVLFCFNLSIVNVQSHISFRCTT